MINLKKLSKPDNSEVSTAPLNSTDELANTTEELPKKTHNGVNLKVWIERLELAKKIAINLAVYSVLGGIGFIFYAEWQREPIIIEPLTVPASFANQGYNGAVLSSRLMDKVSLNREASYARLPDDQKYLFPVEVTNSDVTDALKLEIPDTGISLNMIIRYMRRMRGLETRIYGDLVGDSQNLEISIRVNGKLKTVSGNLSSLNGHLEELAEHIMENTQPYFLALNYYSKKEYDKALELVQKTLDNKDKRDDSFAYDLWGRILTRQNHYDEAVEKYNQSIEANPELDSPYLGLGFIHYQKKDYAAAINSYQTIINRNPTNHSAYNDLALILDAQGDSNAAIENYKKSIAANPKYALAYYNYGALMLGKGEYQQAIAQFNSIIDLPNSKQYFKAHNGLCNALSKINKFTEAIEHCELAIKIKPKDTNIYDTLGSVYVAQKDYSKALASFQTAINYNVDNSEAQQHLAEVFAIMGKCEDAKKHLELALKLNSATDKTVVEKQCSSGETKEAMRPRK